MKEGKKERRKEGKKERMKNLFNGSISSGAESD